MTFWYSAGTGNTYLILLNKSVHSISVPNSAPGIAYAVMVPDQQGSAALNSSHSLLPTSALSCLLFEAITRPSSSTNGRIRSNLRGLAGRGRNTWRFSPLILGLDLTAVCIVTLGYVRIKMFKIPCFTTKQEAVAPECRAVRDGHVKKPKNPETARRAAGPRQTPGIAF